MQKIRYFKLRRLNQGRGDIHITVYRSNYDDYKTLSYEAKSLVNCSPKLLSPSFATTLIFDCSGLTHEQKSTVNSLITNSGKNDIKGKIKMIKKIRGSLDFIGFKDDTFMTNMEILNPNIYNIIASMVDSYFSSDLRLTKDLLNTLITNNPFSYRSHHSYTNAIGNFLVSVALGFNTKKPWKKFRESLDGFVLLMESGEKLVFHVDDLDGFDQFLLESTYFDTPSSSDHDFGYIKADGVRDVIELCFQVRFDIQSISNLITRYDQYIPDNRRQRVV